MPQQFGNLKSLQLLHLDGNYQSLPPSFSGLTDLEDLNIVQLGQLPEGIGKLKKLKNIYLVGSFTKVPESLSELTLVENLVLEGKYEYLPKDIGNLKNMKWFSSESSLLKEIPESFGQLSELTHVVLYNNKLKTLPASFFNLPKIYRLSLSYNQLTHLQEEFSKISGTLRVLEIHGYNFSNDEWARFKKLLPNTSVFVLLALLSSLNEG